MKRFIPIIIVVCAILGLTTAICLASGSEEALSDYTADGGRVFALEDRLIFSEVIDEMPKTIEATIKFPANFNTNGGDIIANYGNDSKRANTFVLQISDKGAPILSTIHNSDSTDKCEHTFSNVNVYTGEWVNLAIVCDGTSLHCYVDGELKQTITCDRHDFAMTRELFLGGDYRTNSGIPNSYYFKGAMKNLALYSEARSAEEISADAVQINADDESLVAYYELAGTQIANIIPDLSKNNIEIIRENITGGLELVDNGDNKSLDRYIASEKLENYTTIEVMLKADVGEYGVIYGNYVAGTGHADGSANLEIEEHGRIKYRTYDSEYKTNSKSNSVTFNNVNVWTGEWIHITVVSDVENMQYRCYVNGELADTAKMTNVINAVPQKPMMLGRDYRTGAAQVQYSGKVMSLVTYSDVRSEREIKNDIMCGPEYDENLLSYYDMTFADNSATIPDRSGNGAHLVNKAKPVDEFAIEGSGLTIDTNTLKYPEQYQSEKFPKTVEFTVKINEADAGIQRTVLSNYRAANNEYSYTLRLASGIPRLFIYYNGTKEYLEYRFTGIQSKQICTGEWTNVAIVTDIPNKEFRCYINGILTLTKSFYDDHAGKLTDEQIDAIDFDFTLNSKLNPGATHGTGGAANPFTNGYIKSIVTYSDVRTADEIAGDVYFPGADGMTSYWDMSNVGVYKDIPDRSNNFNTMKASNADTVTYAKETQGMTFTRDTDYEVASKLDTAPLTFEAMVKFPTSGGGSDTGGKKTAGINNVIFGNFYGKTVSNVLNFGISHINPAVFVRDYLGNSYTFLFDEVEVNTEYWEHIAITFDAEAGYAYCYQNGVLKQKITYNGELAGIDWTDNKYTHTLGGDWQSERRDYFKRKLGYVALYTDIRSAEEIYSDAKGGISVDDEGLMCYYDCMNGAANGVISDNKDGKYNVSLFAPFYEKEERDPESYDYSIAVVGDTQMLTYKYNGALTSLYDWIIANAESKKIEFVVGLGDINENDTDKEWVITSAEIEKLRDAGIPQSLVCGGVHDSLPQFNKYLPYTEYVTAYDGQVVYGFYDDGTGVYSLSNSYQLITIGDTPYMFLSLEWAPLDGHVAWANEVIAAHPEYNVIISTHAYLADDGTHYNTWHHATPDGSGTSPKHNGIELWNDLVRKHANIVMVLAGHDVSDYVLMREDYGDHGNRVVQMLINPQHLDAVQGGTGMIAMLYFSDNGKTVNFEYYSTAREMYYREENQFSFEMPKVEADAASITEASVSLGQDIKVNYYARLLGKYESAVMRFTLGGTSVTVKGVKAEADGLYRFTFDGIAPQLIGDVIKAELVLDGETVDTAKDFSIENYLKALLKKDRFELAITAEQCAALHTLVRDILNYGAAAQNYRDYNTDSLVNEGVSGGSVFDAESVVSVKSQTTPTGDGTVKFKTATVRFDSINSIRFDFAIGSANLADLTIVVGDKTYTSKDFIVKSEGVYSIYTDGITALDFDKEIVACVCVGGEVVHSVTYSINSYVKSMYQSESMGALARAIFCYGKSSEAYVAAFTK